MNWGKTKTLLIVLLIAANLLAFSMYIGLKYDRTMLPEEMIENVIENLGARGVTVQNGAIMREKQSIPIYTAIKEKPENCKKKLERILDLLIENDGEYSEKNVPDGIAVVKKASGGEASAFLTSNSRLTAVSSEISDSEREGVLGVDFGGVNSENQTADKSCMNTVKRFYQAVSKSTKRGTATFGFRTLEVREYGDGSIVFCVQTADDIDLPAYTARFYFSSDGTLLLADGVFFIGEAEKAYSANLLDGVNLIYRMELSEVSEIISESNAFSVIAIEGDSNYFVPSYSVIYKDKNGNIVNHIYDSVTGELKSKY